MCALRIGVDAGGTFTDFVVIRDDAQVESFKIRSNPRAPARVILEGLERAAGEREADVVHGSTVATNALVERKGARTAFVTTEGFEDLIQIGRQRRDQLYNLTPPPRQPLVESSQCYGVAERTHFDGTVAKRPAATRLRRLRSRLQEAGVESVAICFLHACQNPANEKAAAELLGELGYVCCSHEVCPEFREYERSTTTVINAYVGPLMDAYLGELEQAGRRRISIMQSNGGFMSAREARRHAVRTVLSGPAGGVVGAMEAARASGFDRILSFDMGGTSTDVSLAVGSPREATESSIDGLPIRAPMLDIHTVGAGGGSIARVDEGGLLRVGPESAGADPGPACYGVGMAPTLTDAHVVLGRIASRQFLGGEMRIDAERSAAVLDRIAEALSLDRIAAAEGIAKVANANMQRAIRAVSIERGHDPREFALVAFGGCGGLHACQVAEELGIRTVIAPQHAGVLSALGMLLADRVRDYAAGALGLTGFERRFRQLERQGRKESPGAEMERTADLRYAGQSYELTVPWNSGDPAAPFHSEHERVYGYSNPDKPVEIVTLRVRARVKADKPELGASPRTRSGIGERRRVWLAGRWRVVPVYRRGQLRRAAKTGPALVLDYGSTTLAPPGWTLRLDRAGNIVMKQGRRPAR